MRQLVQVVNKETGVAEWCEVATGEVLQRQQSQPSLPVMRVDIGELLFQEDPRLHEKLTRGKAMSWQEISLAADIVLRAVSQDSLRHLFGAKSMREIKRAIETMLAAQRLCAVLSPRLHSSSPVGVGEAKAATGAMRALLTLPGQR